MRQRGNELLRRALDLALVVGVFYAQKKHAARLVRQPFAHDGLIQSAQMHESRGAGRKARHLGVLRQNARRIFLFNVCRSLFYVGEKQFGEFCVIHNNITPY